MSRLKLKKNILKANWIEKLGVKDQFQMDGSQLFCQPCRKMFNFKQIGELQQHLATNLHKKQFNLYKAKPEKQILLKDSVEAQNPFNFDLCRATVAADIPCHKLKNPVLKQFLEKYTKRSVPDSLTLSRNYNSKLYSESIDQIRLDIDKYPVWIGVDETTDACGRFMANVLVGALKKDEPGRSHLLACKELQTTNNSTITQLILDATHILWPGLRQDEINNRFVLFLTDAVPYMVKAGKNLKRIYTNLKHVTCIVHGLNRVAEEIRSLFPTVDSLIGSLKAVFRKAPSRVRKYKELFPELELPPEPVITRWGTWLEAVEFYAKNIQHVKSVVESLDGSDAASIQKSQQLLQSTDIVRDLSFLSANYTFLTKYLVMLQESECSLRGSLYNLKEIEDKIFSVGGETGRKVADKFRAVFNKNPNLKDMKVVSSVIEGNEVSAEEIDGRNLPASIIASLKFAPLTTTDPERSFSLQKMVLSDRRHNLSAENMEKILVSHYELASSN